MISDSKYHRTATGRILSRPRFLAHAIAAQTHHDTKAMARAKFHRTEKDPEHSNSICAGDYLNKILSDFIFISFFFCHKR